MSQAQTFGCDACGRRFAWKAAMAGRRVRCRCGVVFACPRERPAEESGGDVYDVAPEAPVAMVADAGSTLRELHIKGGKVLPLAAMEPSARGGALAYRAPEDFPARVDAETMKGVWMPLWLLGGGLLIEIAARILMPQMWWTPWNRPGERVEKALLYVGLSTVIGTGLVLLLIGIPRVLMRILGATPWPLHPEAMDSVALKLLAIMVAPSAALWLLAPIFLLMPGFGLIISAVGEFAISLALVRAMFDVDDVDAWFFAAVIAWMKMLALAVAVAAVMN